MRPVAVLALVLALAGCRDSSDTPPPTLAWTRVDVGAAPTQLAGSTAGLLAGEDAGPGRAPSMVLVRDTPVAVPVRSSTYYARRSGWLAITTDGSRVYAVGGQNGGAHANVRWSTWSGSVTGLREDPQTFPTFGGPDAGGLVGLAAPAGTPVIVGAWHGSDGFDIALWQLTGRTWTRAPSPAPLRSSADEQVTARGVTAVGSGLLVTGAVQAFDGGRARLLPAVWSASTPDGPWTRTLLSTTGTVGQAVSAGCEDGTCWVLGDVDDAAAAWQVTLAPDGSVTTLAATGLPLLPVGATASLALPILIGADPVLVLPDGAGSVLLVGTAHSWTRVAGPTGTPLSAAASGGRLYVTTTDAAGHTSLWSAATAPAS